MLPQRDVRSLFHLISLLLFSEYKKSAYAILYAPLFFILTRQKQQAYNNKGYGAIRQRLAVKFKCKPKTRQRNFVKSLHDDKRSALPAHITESFLNKLDCRNISFHINTTLITVNRDDVSASTLVMEEMEFSYTSVNFYHAAW